MSYFNLKFIKADNEKYSIKDKELSAYIAMTYIDRYIGDKTKCKYYICLLNILNYVTDKISERDYEFIIEKFNIDKVTEDKIYKLYLDNLIINNVYHGLQDRIYGLSYEIEHDEKLFKVQ